MNKLISNFKANSSESKKSVALEVLFDISIVAIISLIFNGFIINNHSSVFDQKYFMVSNAALLSTHWFSNLFFRQRYEKKNILFRMLAIFQVLSLIIMAVGIDLMVFRENNTPLQKAFLRHSSIIIFLVGFILSRFIIFLLFLFACIANRENRSLVMLTLFKSLSRFIVVLLAVSHLIVVSVVGNDAVAITTYIYMPVYLVIEFSGNVIGINKKNLKNSPKVSLSEARTRNSKVNLLYISSFFVSGSIQFAFYFKSASDLHMLGSLAGTYIIGTLIWWAYMDRVHRFDMKQNAKNLIFYSFINILQASSLILVGSMLINAHTDTHLNFIFPTVFFALTLFLVSFILVSITFSNGDTKACLKRKLKFEFILHTLPFIILFTVMGVVTLYFSIPNYWVYIVICISFVTLNVLSRILIERKINIL